MRQSRYLYMQRWGVAGRSSVVSAMADARISCWPTVSMKLELAYWQPGTGRMNSHWLSQYALYQAQSFALLSYKFYIRSTAWMPVYFLALNTADPVGILMTIFINNCIKLQTMNNYSSVTPRNKHRPQNMFLLPTPTANQ